MLRPKSAEPKWVASPAAALPGQPARQYQHGEPRRNAPWRKSRNRTSMPEPQDSAPTSNRRYCSGKCSSPPIRRSHECEPEAPPKGATDRESREHRSRGRSVAALYNESHTHTSLGWMTPVECCCRGQDRRRMKAGNSPSGWMRNRATLRPARHFAADAAF